jgi:uncharacterized coiled-coil protein SlyX
MNMPGRQKKVHNDKSNRGDHEPTHEKQDQVSAHSSTPEGANANPPPCLDGKPDFTKSLIMALNDPAVKLGFEAILKPLISAHVNEVLQPLINNKITESLKPLEEKISEVESEIQVINDILSEQQIKSSSANDRIMDKIKDLEKGAKGKNLRFTGLKPNILHLDSNKDLSDQASLKATLDVIFGEAGIVGVKADDVDELVKINTPNQQGASHSILLKFSSEAKRNKLFFQKKKLKNCKEKYYINEDLTKDIARIYKRTRQEVKNGTLHSCWTKFGTVWAKSAPDGTPFSIAN